MPNKCKANIIVMFILGMEIGPAGDTKSQHGKLHSSNRDVDAQALYIINAFLLFSALILVFQLEFLVACNRNLLLTT